MKVRVWCEFLTPKELTKEEVVLLLKRYNTNLCLAVHYNSLNDDYAELVSIYNKHNLPITFWLLLKKEDGYWPNEQNVDLFYQYLKEVFNWCNNKGLNLDYIAVDLEPPLYLAKEIEKERNIIKKLFRIYKILRSNCNKKRFNTATQKFEEVLKLIHDNNAKAIVPAIPFIMEDIKLKKLKMQDILETPVTNINWDIVSLMIYNSAHVGLSKGLLNFNDAYYLLYEYSVEAKKYFKDRVSISIGLTSTGIFGNEPYYRTPQEMLPDVEIVKEAGINDIAIYNLEGILKYEKPAEWFEMVQAAGRRLPKISIKIKLLRALLRSLVRILF